MSTMDVPSEGPGLFMLPMAEIPWCWWVPYPDYDEGWPPPPPISWTRAWCREQQQRALQHGHAFYEARYDYDGSAAPVLVVGVEPTCPGCGATLPLAETAHAFAQTAFAAAQHAHSYPYRLTFDWYSPICVCGVSSDWELRWQNYGSVWDLRSRYRDEQSRGPLPEAALTIAVAVRGAKRHRSKPEDEDAPIDEDLMDF
jgi:hypothetical protein